MTDLASRHQERGAVQLGQRTGGTRLRTIPQYQANLLHEELTCIEALFSAVALAKIAHVLLVAKAKGWVD